MAETIEYSPDGLSFLIRDAIGVPIASTQSVPETGVAYLATDKGGRVVVFPNYNLPGRKPKVNQVFSLLETPTVIKGICASASDISAAFEEDEESELDEDDDSSYDDEDEESEDSEEDDEESDD